MEKTARWLRERGVDALPYHAGLPDEGLIIWHVDANGSNDNQEMTPTSHYMVSVEQADNKFDLENNIGLGGPDDLFHDGINNAFSDSTSPDANWWNGHELILQPGNPI